MLGVKSLFGSAKTETTQDAAAIIADKGIDATRIPQHIAIIMDGNGRWAKKQGAKRVFGHQNAIKAVRDTVEGCAEIGVKYLTLYAFSTENWGRPQAEIDALMQLLVHTIRSETKTLNTNGVKLTTIGDTAALPASCQAELAEAMELTESNNRMTLVLALNYSGKWDITQALKQIAEAVQAGQLDASAITDTHINDALATCHFPDPELLIRTSGEMRISNFMLWQAAYTEIFITDTLWPDFRKDHLHQAILNYQQRQRRFGKVAD